jgi:hypothetical protein
VGHARARIVARAFLKVKARRRRIITDGPKRLSALHPELTYLALPPFVGPKAALKTAGILPWSTSVRSA